MNTARRPNRAFAFYGLVCLFAGGIWVLLYIPIFGDTLHYGDWHALKGHALGMALPLLNVVAGLLLFWRIRLARTLLLAGAVLTGGTFLSILLSGFKAWEMSATDSWLVVLGAASIPAFYSILMCWMVYRAFKREALLDAADPGTARAQIEKARRWSGGTGDSIWLNRYALTIYLIAAIASLFIFLEPPSPDDSLAIDIYGIPFEPNKDASEWRRGGDSFPASSARWLHQYMHADEAIESLEKRGFRCGPSECTRTSTRLVYRTIDSIHLHRNRSVLNGGWAERRHYFIGIPLETRFSARRIYPLPGWHFDSAKPLADNMQLWIGTALQRELHKLDTQCVQPDINEQHACKVNRKELEMSFGEQQVRDMRSAIPKFKDALASLKAIGVHCVRTGEPYHLDCERRSFVIENDDPFKAACRGDTPYFAAVKADACAEPQVQRLSLLFDHETGELRNIEAQVAGQSATVAIKHVPDLHTLTSGAAELLLKRNEGSDYKLTARRLREMGDTELRKLLAEIDRDSQLAVVQRLYAILLAEQGGRPDSVNPDERLVFDRASMAAALINRVEAKRLGLIDDLLATAPLASAPLSYSWGIAMQECKALKPYDYDGGMDTLGAGLARNLAKYEERRPYRDCVAAFWMRHMGPQFKEDTEVLDKSFAQRMTKSVARGGRDRHDRTMPLLGMMYEFETLPLPAPATVAALLPLDKADLVENFYPIRELAIQYLSGP